MLKARDHKGHNREKDGRDLPADGLGGIGHPDGDAHEEVAEDAAHERIAERQPRFRLCDGDNGRCELAAERGKDVPRHTQRRNEQRPRKVAQVDNEPVAQHLPRRDRVRQNAHDHEIVAGKKLAPGHDDHGETGRKHAAGDELCQRRIADRRRGSRGRDARKRDERARKAGEQKHPPQRQCSLGAAGGKIILRDLFGCAHR